MLDGAGDPAGGKLVILIYQIKLYQMNRLALILTVYNRFEHLSRTLKEISMQSRKDFDLFIVNNSDRDIEELVDIPCEIINMGNKYKHYGRYFAAKDIIERGYEIVSFLDDDIVISPRFIAEAYLHYDPKFVKSFWAFEVFDDYWQRKKLSGSRAGHYCGGGGLLAPAELFRVPELYECPEEYWVLDDIWMSHVILAYTHYEIRMFPAKVVLLDDHKASYKKLKKQKSEMAAKYILPYK